MMILIYCLHHLHCTSIIWASTSTTPLGPPPAPPFFPHPSRRFLEPFQQPTLRPRPPPPRKRKGLIGILPALSAPPLSPTDYFLLGPSARSVSPGPRPLTPTVSDGITNSTTNFITSIYTFE